MAYVFEGNSRESIDVPIDLDSEVPVIRQAQGNWAQVTAAEERIDADRKLGVVRREVVNTLEALAAGTESDTILGALMSGPKDLYEVAASCRRLPQEVWSELAILQGFGIVAQFFDEDSPDESTYSLHPNP